MFSDFIWPFLPPYMGVIPNPKMAFIFSISCILVLIFPIFMLYLPKCEGKGSFPKSKIKSLVFNSAFCVTFHARYHLLTFSKLFQKNYFRNTIRVANGLDPDWDRCSANILSVMIWIQTVSNFQVISTKGTLARKELNADYT